MGYITLPRRHPYPIKLLRPLLRGSCNRQNKGKDNIFKLIPLRKSTIRVDIIPTSYSFERPPRGIVVILVIVANSTYSYQLFFRLELPLILARSACPTLGICSPYFADYFFYSAFPVIG